jgi:membrane protein DedA with SNARE-associated domain/rhodanese-related sulfurtransferase
MFAGVNWSLWGVLCSVRCAAEVSRMELTAITYPTILIAVFARQLGVPIPAELFLLAAGALARAGSLDLSLVILAGIVGCIAADSAWFMAGRQWGYRLVRALSSFSWSGPRWATRTRKLFARLGLATLMFAKFVPGLDGVLPPLAGMLDAAIVPFLLLDATGALFWSTGYCGVGYLFAGQLTVVLTTLARLRVIVAVVLAVVACHLGWKAWQLLYAMRKLRPRIITPAELQERLKSGKKVALLDLLNVEAQDGTANSPGIPGALRVNSARLRNSTKVRVPPDVQTVLYSSTPNQLSSARAAIALRRKGICNVWVLEGGLKAWQDLGLPTTTTFSSPDEFAARFGIEVVVS